MPPPPPPPMGAPPPPAAARPPPASAGRGDLLKSIEGFKKGKLKNAVTVDKSAPVTSSRSAPSSTPSSAGGGSPLSGSSSGSPAPFAMAGGLFAGGMPKLRKTGRGDGIASSLPAPSSQPTAPPSAPTKLNLNKPTLQAKAPAASLPPVPPTPASPSPIPVQPPPTFTPKAMPPPPGNHFMPAPPSSTMNRLPSLPTSGPLPPAPPSSQFSVPMRPVPTPIPPLPPAPIQNAPTRPPPPASLLESLGAPAPTFPSGPPPPSPGTSSVPVPQPTDTPARALHNFNPQKKEDLALKKGDIVVNINKSPTGQKVSQWWMGKVYGTNRCGFFPANYVQELTVLEEVTIQRSPSAQMKAPSDLSLIEGDRVQILLKNEKRWFGRKLLPGGVNPLGFFPSYLAKEVSQPATWSPNRVYYHSHSRGAN